ncbi:MAG: nucleoside triphosphate pyrophosphohydrolase family protein [Pseudomonadota bacterium]
MNTLALVRDWHEHFGVPVETKPVLPQSRVAMRLAILEEEVRELREAVEANDMTEVLDALCDIQFVLDGTFLEFGLHQVKDVAFQEVYRSNMSKLGEDGEPVHREDGKVLKGPNFTPPDLKPYVRA